MMKVSDPIIFGHVVEVFFRDTFARYGDALAAAGLTPDDGLGADPGRARRLPEGQEIRAAFEAELAAGPPLAMVDSDRGITNLHVPSDVIVDASMPAMIRTSGHMWGPDGEEADTLAVIPDSSYADIYQVVIDDCRAHGAYDPATMGSVPNVGLMAQAAEEYGSHDKTFEIAAAGTVRVVDAAGSGPARASRWRPATSSGCARRRTCRSATGSGWPSSGPGDGGPGRVLAGRGPPPRRQLSSPRCATLPRRARHRGAAIEHPGARRRPAPSPSSGSGGARTPSRSRATSCGTT